MALIRIVTANNKSINEGIYDILHRALLPLEDCGQVLTESLKTTVLNHFENRYPGSKHYSPSKVVDSTTTNKSGSIDINVPGITRALRTLVITPKHGQYLTIPMHQSAYGTSARDYNDLIFIKKKDNKAFLARKNGSALIFMYFLSKQVVQLQDTTLLPTKETLAHNTIERLKVLLQKSKNAA